MNQKLFRAFIIASSITLVTEIIENKFHFNLYQALILSIPAFIVGIIIDRQKNEKEFENKISKFIISLHKIKKENEIKPEFIQVIMCQVTTEFAEIFDQKKKLNHRVKSIPIEEIGEIKLPCLICESKHITDSNMNCKNCGLSSEKWTYLNSQLSLIKEN